MAWPPPVFRNDITNTTAQQDEHPAVHNEVNTSLNDDFRPKIDAVQTDADNAQAAADQVAADLADHEGNGATVDGFVNFRITVNDFVTHYQWWPIRYYPARHGIHRVLQTNTTPTGGTPYTYNASQTLGPQVQWRFNETAGQTGDDFDIWHPDIPFPSGRSDIGTMQFWSSSSTTVMYRQPLTRNGTTDCRLMTGDYSRQGGLGDGRWRSLGNQPQDRTPCEINMLMSLRAFWWG